MESTSQNKLPKLNTVQLRILGFALIGFNICSSTEQSGNIWQASGGINEEIGWVGHGSQGSKWSPATEKRVRPQTWAPSFLVILFCEFKSCSKEQGQLVES